MARGKDNGAKPIWESNRLGGGPVHRFRAGGGGSGQQRQMCRMADEAGFLDAVGATRGECLNTLRGPASENAANFAAGLCGAEHIQQEVGATNKGECIKRMNSLPDGDE